MLGGKLIHCQNGLKWYTFILSFTNGDNLYSNVKTNSGKY